jgi:hypothetical protein
MMSELKTHLRDLGIAVAICAIMMLLVLGIQQVQAMPPNTVPVDNTVGVPSAPAMEREYLICQGEDGTIYQYEGRVTVTDDGIILIKDETGAESFVSGLDCDTSDTSVSADGTVIRVEPEDYGKKLDTQEEGVCVEWGPGC